MSQKRFKLSSETVLQYQIMDNDTDLNENEVVDLLNEFFEHNLHLQRLIESLAKVTGEPIEDTIERYKEKKEIYTTSKRPMRFVGGRKI